MHFSFPKASKTNRSPLPSSGGTVKNMQAAPLLGAFVSHIQHSHRVYNLTYCCLLTFKLPNRNIHGNAADSVVQYLSFNCGMVIK